MAWLQLETDIGSRPPEEIETLLEALGAVSVTLRDGGDHPLLEPKPGETPLWPSVIVTALFPHDVSQEHLSKALEPFCPATALSFVRIDEQDWQKSFEQSLEPRRYGTRLWVVPDSSTGVPAGTARLILKPGMAFGTGEHPTTSMCLDWLAGLDLQGKHVLDYGCGSGILGLAAAQLGAAQVTLTDIDPQALQASAENSAQNGLEGLVSIGFPDKIVTSVQFDILLANILSGTLIELGPQLDGLMRPGAAMAITGILVDQAAQVSAAWSEWADMEIGSTMQEWVLMTGIKHHDATAGKSETED